MPQPEQNKPLPLDLSESPTCQPLQVTPVPAYRNPEVFKAVTASVGRSSGAMKSRPCLQFKEGNVVSASYQEKDLEREFGENKPESRVRPRMGVGVDGVIKKLLRSSGGRYPNQHHWA